MIRSMMRQLALPPLMRTLSRRRRHSPSVHNQNRPLSRSNIRAASSVQPQSPIHFLLDY